MKKLIIAAFASLIAHESHALPPSQELDCTLAPSQSAVVNRLTGFAGGAGTAVVAAAKATGLTAVSHSSGAYILSGAGGYIAGTLGTAIVAPLIVGVSVIVGGTAATIELVCAPKNHPVLVTRVNEATADFLQRSRDQWNEAQKDAGRAVGVLRPAAEQLMIGLMDAGREVLASPSR
jgi:hypothetical protein